MKSFLKYLSSFYQVRIKFFSKLFLKFLLKYLSSSYQVLQVD